MARQVTFSVKDSLKKIKKDMEKFDSSLKAQINQAVKDVALAAYASIAAQAQKELHRTRQDYLKALNFQTIGDNAFLISLDGDWATKIEDGYSSYNMVPGMLASNKNVSVGKNAGQPWVRQAKDGHKYAIVPMEHKPFAKGDMATDLAAGIKNAIGKGLNGSLQPMTQIFKNLEGGTLEGKVAVADPDSQIDPNLRGLVKYQKAYKDKNGKETVQSIYVTYRAISENGKPWQHPGWRGAHFFQKAEQDVVEQLDKIIRTLT